MGRRKGAELGGLTSGRSLSGGKIKKKGGGRALDTLAHLSGTPTSTRKENSPEMGEAKTFFSSGEK